MSCPTTKTGPGGPQGVHQQTWLKCPGGLRFLPFLGAAALYALVASCGSKNETPPQPPAPQTNAAASAAAVSPELVKLIGRWERPDGGYVVEIKGVDPSGKLDVAYYNPEPINVSRAAAWREKGVAKLVIELRDVNYPGCTYTLEHSPQTDQLFGQYYQASLQETYEVVFTRIQ